VERGGARGGGRKKPKSGGMETLRKKFKDKKVKTDFTHKDAKTSKT
jgi:hypothetical protein